MITAGGAAVAVGRVPAAATAAEYPSSCCLAPTARSRGCRKQDRPAPTLNRPASSNGSLSFKSHQGQGAPSFSCYSGRLPLRQQPPLLIAMDRQNHPRIGTILPRSFAAALQQPHGFGAPARAGRVGSSSHICVSLLSAATGSGCGLVCRRQTRAKTTRTASASRPCRAGGQTW